MDVREAVEADADTLAELADSPVDVMRNLVHDRTVRVAVDPDTDETEADIEEHEDDSRDDELSSIVGFVSFDARDETVHITQIAGSEAACARLLEEPIRFARGEAMAVELLVPDGERAVREAAEAADLATAGSGPRFSGQPTTRYRLEPESDAT
ncbi:hypothetical protein HLRTI_000221 [Halorhabdus tiamatea SARL4B]|uniref:Uncharacterized protein n=1 Tax=Halorhabdus tiamatea SARL4B TaxID=1033806 RepID=F7PJX4_9EURY|nr:hypothetical protein [Halorhabdus tiamatea]ERJ07503.1 hypothetical protein HLRTI_000221 [Halorhabdus tiamatea SARL4B]CCQ33547.1 conserved hypothetical protein [Halorhabdus tiamatea SARL4B]